MSKDQRIASLRRALEKYAKDSNWGNDDWNIKAVFQRGYGDPGKIARRALERDDRGASK